MSRFDNLKEKLQAEIKSVKAKPGNILVVCPKDEKMQFCPEYAQWLATTLKSLLPPGVLAMVVPDGWSSFEEYKPCPHPRFSPEERDAYMDGWRDAIGVVSGKGGS